MRFDVLSIFPDYFAPLDLSLLGKARREGLVELRVHDLRDWTNDPHKSVDDTPCGGGAGMVMRPDIWGLAIDEVCGFSTGETTPICPDTFRRVLAIPTPSGQPLTQHKVEQIANVDQIVIACGRYEGIDARVGQYYASQQVDGIEVFEFSLGDYVLNGGEVAAMALIEAIARLEPEVIGNPESLVEESYSGDGLLEYPVYTRPTCWRGLSVPPVLLGGNHAYIKRWRRNQSLSKTQQIRPELIRAKDENYWDKTDREALARSGKLVGTMSGEVTIRAPRPEESLELAALGAQTFPMACPKWMTPEAIEAFCAVEFAPQAVADRINDPENYRYLVAEVEGALVGYTLMLSSVDDQAGFEIPIDSRGIYLSKCYVKAQFHSSGLSGALLEESIADMQNHRPESTWVYLGTSTENKRAIKFYRRHDFIKIGTRIFDVGGILNDDIVLGRKLGEANQNVDNGE